LIPLYQDNHETYGILLLSGKEARFYRISSCECQLLKKESLTLLKKHGKGGQSAARFGRLADNKRERTVEMVMDLFWRMFYEPEKGQLNVSGVIVAGPAEMKKDLIGTALFKKYFLRDLICCRNLNQIDDKTIHIMFEDVQDVIQKRKDKTEMEILQKVLDLQMTNSELLCYGLKEVKEKLADGLLKKVIGIKGGGFDSKEMKEVKMLLEDSGAELQLLETRGVVDRLQQEYGGWLGVQWHAY